MKPSRCDVFIILALFTELVGFMFAKAHISTAWIYAIGGIVFASVAVYERITRRL